MLRDNDTNKIKVLKKNLSLVTSMERNKKIFKEYCPHCGYELSISIDSKYNYVVKFCGGRCADYE